MVGFVFTLLLVGLIAGLMARGAVPGRDAMGVSSTMVLGIVGSVIGAVLALLAYNASAGRRTAHP